MRIDLGAAFNLAAVALAITLVAVAGVSTTGPDGPGDGPTKTQGTSDTALGPATAPQEADEDTLGPILALCRDLAPEDLAEDRLCREAWAAERRRFFGSASNEPSDGTAAH